MSTKVINIPAYLYTRNPDNPDLVKENFQVAITLVCNSNIFNTYNTILDGMSGGTYKEKTVATWSSIDPPSDLMGLANLSIGDNIFNKAIKTYWAYEEHTPSHFITDRLNWFGLPYYQLNPLWYSGSTYPRLDELVGLNNHVYDEHCYVGKCRVSGTQELFESGMVPTGVVNEYTHLKLTQRLSPDTGEVYKNDLECAVTVFPDDILTGNVQENVTRYNTNGKQPIRFIIDVSFNKNTGKMTGTLKARKYPSLGWQYFDCFYGYASGGPTGETDSTPDEDNPYGLPGISGPGGGDGDYPNIDETDPAEIPALPDVSAADLGFLTMYNPTVAQMQALAQFMWSSAFDLDTYKKLFSDPMQSIIGLGILPIAPDIGGARTVHFGAIDSEVTMNTIANQFKRLDCGSVDIEKYVGCFMDYSPYTKISLYLPYIGIRDLSPDDIMGGSIHVVYNIDLLTGACAAFVEHSERGVLYSYNGSCITNIPLTASNYSGAIQNAVSAIASGITTAVGMATGAAPVTAMGITGLVTGAANTAINSKPNIQRSGNLGGSAGIMSIQRPYVIIERPNLSVAGNVQHYVGQTSNMTATLGNMSGFTMVEYIHLHGIPATSEELSEIETLLKQGVIL